MTITTDMNTASIHQHQDLPLDQEGQGRSDKQSPNRAGIPMLRGARRRSAKGSSGPQGSTPIGPFGCDSRGF
jgi:hypothetical protein